MRDLALNIDTAGGRRAGLEQALREAVRSGRLAAGNTMPSTRALASDLGWSRATVVAAYEQLVAEGYLSARQGAQTVVAELRTVATLDASVDRRSPSPATDFRPGEPDPSSFPRARWLRSLRHVTTALPDDVFAYPDPRGVADLRRSLAEYLARARAVVADAALVRITGGYTSAVGFVAEALRSVGVDTVAVEDPTLFFVRDVLALSGVDVVPIAVDEEGIDVISLAASGARAVIVTPAHQYPTGVIMSARRRQALLAWADAHDGWIIEDDYDGEFRYDRQPIGALQGLDPARVLYAGSASKALSPALRLGWAVVPPELLSPLDTVRHVRAMTSAIDQHALAHFIDHGELDRHLRLVRARYRARQLGLVDRLQEELPALDVTASAAGLHLTVGLPVHVDEAEVVERAAAAGVALFGLAPHWAREPSTNGLVLGYSRPPEHRFAEELDRLIDVLDRVTRP